ncbi:unnamed protein product [Larinioides sclopetarius]|uniref:Fibrinogen C-terminal domain-containing protein n=1 Tax=Larinioides sclopetarius TaxID=280406 RepID=A0AAV1ZGH7_9ARAC
MLIMCFAENNLNSTDTSDCDGVKPLAYIEISKKLISDVIQRRGKFSSQQDFDKDWESYKNVFGNLTKEFWLGNENIRILCLKGCEIRFDLQDVEGEKGFALYKSFNLSSSNYRLSISGYTGNVDGMQHFNQDFSTKDKGDTVTAKAGKGGWWHNEGNFNNLNGIYLPGKDMYLSVSWYEWRHYKNLARVEIKVRPN